MGAISPTQALYNKSQRTLPPEVFAVFNELIVRELRDGRADVNQREVERMIADRMGISPQEVVARKYLDVEPYYRTKGWVVRYDKPAYCEFYDPTFIFTTSERP